MLRGTKLAIAVILAASGMSLIGISGASAGCRTERVFTNTTCDWLGRNCVNHFANRQICDAPAAPKLVGAPAAPIIAPGAKLITAPNGGAGIVATGGGNSPGAGVVASGGGNKPGNGH
jgi:hypothetical protein